MVWSGACLPCVSVMTQLAPTKIAFDCGTPAFGLHAQMQHTQPLRGRDPLRSTNSDSELTLGETSRLRSGSTAFIRGQETAATEERLKCCYLIGYRKQSWKRFRVPGMVWTLGAACPLPPSAAAPPNTPPQAQPKPANRASPKCQPPKSKTHLPVSKTKH